MNPGIPWDELVVSWNAAKETRITVSARSVSGAEHSEWYVLGRWSTDPARGARTSVAGQSDHEGRVDTDTLLLRVRRPGVQLRLTFPSAQEAAGLRLLALAFTDSKRPSASPPLRALPRAWGVSIPVPIRSQTEFPEGIQSWCSPASLSMVLAHWAGRLSQPDLDLPVPVVAAGVNDPAWPGTGNWPFNTAFAGSFPSLRSCVARMNSLHDLEEWIAGGSPVIASVDGNRLRALSSAEPLAPSGHLVVVRGFTSTGDVEILDPGVPRERVAKTVPRAVFERAWMHSRRTTYLVWPSESPANFLKHSTQPVAVPPDRGTGGITGSPAS